MQGEESLTQVTKRLEELAIRADRIDQNTFSSFLTPPEAQIALSIAKKQGVSVTLFGGYEDAEREMACFSSVAQEDIHWPIQTFCLRWPHQTAPAHRDLLGAVMGLGMKRQCIGDIVLEEACAYLFAQETMADHIAQSLCSAGKVHLQIERMDGVETLASQTGQELRITVHSLRLDAIVASGFSLSRTKVGALIQAGHVKLRHVPNQKGDAKVGIGDAISVRGLGRLRIENVFPPTKKGRIPVEMTRYGR